MSKNVLEKIINNWIEYYFPEWWGGSSDLDIGAVNALIDMKLWDYDSLFSVTNWLYQILNSIDTEDEIWLSSWDTRAEIVADDTSMSLISHCYAVMCYIANSTVAMSTILADASATNEVSECWNSITIIAESQLASDLYLASVNWITSLFTYQTAQDAFFTSTARKTQIVSQNLMVIVNDDTLLAQLNTDSVVQACIVNSTTALSTIAWDNDKLEIVKENTAIMNAIAVNSTALAAMSDSDFFEYILEDSTYLTTCAWSTNWKAKINSYAADDLLDPIYFWTGDLGYSTFAALAADDTSMEIVQSNEQAMLIINNNEEADWYLWYIVNSDTLLFLKNNWDILDRSQNNVTMNQTWTTSFETLSNWRKVINFDWSNVVYSEKLNWTLLSTGMSNFTVHVRMKSKSWYNTWDASIWWWMWRSQSSSSTTDRRWVKRQRDAGSSNFYIIYWPSSSSWVSNTTWQIWYSNTEFRLYSFTTNWKTIKLYKNWVLTWTWTWSANVRWCNSWSDTWTHFSIWWITSNASWTVSPWQQLACYIWETVFEKKTETDAEVLDFYNKTKKHYQ